LSQNQGALVKVEKQPIILTQNLLEWMGYKGRKEADKQKNFCKLLRNLEISSYEIGYDHPLAIEYPCVQKEAQLIPPNNINRKNGFQWMLKPLKK
jgi:hypothetical protein